MNYQEKLAKKACQGLAVLLGFDYMKVEPSMHVAVYTVFGDCRYLIRRPRKGQFFTIYDYVFERPTFTWAGLFDKLSGHFVTTQREANMEHNREIEVGSLDEFIIKLELEGLLERN